MKLINIGFMLNADRILCIISPDAAPTKRMIQDSKEKGTLIDALQAENEGSNCYRL